MLTLLALSLVAAASPEAAPRLPEVRGADEPIAKLSRNIGVTENVNPPEPIVRQCVVHAAHAVLWTADPALIGVQDVAIRIRPQGWSPERACAASPSGTREIKLSAEETFDPIAARGRHLVAVYPDGHGVMTSFQVLDMDTGQRVLEDQLNAYKGIDLATAPGGGLTVSWWTGIQDLPCLPRRGERGCWQRILAAKKVPEGVRIPQPDCEAVVARRPSAPSNPSGSAQITIHAHTTIGQPAIEYAPDPATCDESP